MTEKKTIAINRLTGKPYGYRDDSDAGFEEIPFWQRKWTVEDIRLKAEELGKPFSIDPEIAGRLENDLTSGALVLFTEEEVEEVYAKGLIPKPIKVDVQRLVSKTGSNNIAILRLDLLPENDGLRQLKQWFLTNNRC